jgi:hypothetical protein
MSQKTPRKIAKAEVRNKIDSGIKANDMIREGGLGNLLRLRGKKAGLQQREQHRLNAKYGSQHPRVQQANASLEANANYIGGLRMELTRAKTPVIKPEGNAWCVHGYVYDRQGCPIPGAGVDLFSVDGREVPSVVAATTNDKGYYRLDYAPGAGTTTGGQVLDASGDSVLSVAGESAAAGIRTNREAAASDATADTESETERLGEGLRINTNLGGASADDSSVNAETNSERLSEGLRINASRNLNARVSVLVRASDPRDADICADSTLITPRPGVCSYRDLILDTNAYQSPASDKDRRSTRYLGNSATRELHDLKIEKPRCHIDIIRFDHCINFNTQKEAVAADYDFCAYCFGKEKSKR